MATVQEVKRIQRGTQATILNQTCNEMKLKRYHNWAGYPEGGSFPETIGNGSATMFTHLNGDNGSEIASRAAVVYGGYTQFHDACSWVLAWDAPNNISPTTPNKVYAIASSTMQIDKMSWEEIAKELDASVIPEQDGPYRVDATITEQIPDFATLFARTYFAN